MKPLAEIREYRGPAPAPFVGRYGYPYVNVGILGTPIPPRAEEELDNPRLWSQKGYGVGDVVDVRSSLINSRFKSDIRTPSRMVAAAQEVSMASRPADVEIKLKSRPALSLNLDPYASPTGPLATAIGIELASNPSISSKVEKVFSDTDLKAADAAFYLYEKGFDENQIMRMFSVGVLGAKAQRRLVPTRWSITASDDILGKKMISEIHGFKEAGPCAYFGGYLGNNYLVMCFPGPWGFELFEMTVQPNRGKEPDKLEAWTDNEGPYGRTEYASNTVGGYYACRLAVIERLKERMQKASVLVLRFVTEEYSLPLGVWVVREATRKAMSAHPINFSDDKLMIEYAKARARKTFGLDISGLIRRSRLLDQRNKQPKLSRFIEFV